MKYTVRGTTILCPYDNLYLSKLQSAVTLIIAEAFACGLAVLMSRLGNIVEIVENGVTSLHFEARLNMLLKRIY